jgi:glycosyltransferase involved in cell wall biosynthesis
VKVTRRIAATRLDGLRDGVTVVIVNWNTRDVTMDVIEAVQRFSPESTVLVVVDNGSTDGSREAFKKIQGIETLLMPTNVGHGLALDLAVCRARTKIAVTLDSDAVPISEGWLEPAVQPVRDGQALLSGSRSRRNFVHPIYLAVDVRTFVEQRLSFQVHRSPFVDEGDTVWGTNAWDTAELMTPRVPAHRVAFVERTPNPAEGLPGMTAGGVVYHHGGVSRSASGAVTEDAFLEWRGACAALGLTFTRDPTNR